MMLALLQVEFVIGILAYGACIVDDLLRRRWATSVGRQMIAASLVVVGEFVSLLLLSRGFPVPPLVFAVGFAGADAVAIAWLVLRLRTRRESP